MRAPAEVHEQLRVHVSPETSVFPLSFLFFFEVSLYFFANDVQNTAFVWRHKAKLIFLQSIVLGLQFRMAKTYSSSAFVFCVSIACFFALVHRKNRRPGGGLLPLQK